MKNKILLLITIFYSFFALGSWSKANNEGSFTVTVVDSINENVEITGVLEGSNLSSVILEAIDRGDLLLSLNGKAISSFSLSNTFDNWKNDWETIKRTTISNNVTVYADRKNEIQEVSIYIRVPVIGERSNDGPYRNSSHVYLANKSDEEMCSIKYDNGFYKNVDFSRLQNFKWDDEYASEIEKFSGIFEDGNNYTFADCALVSNKDYIFTRNTKVQIILGRYNKDNVKYKTLSSGLGLSTSSREWLSSDTLFVYPCFQPVLAEESGSCGSSAAYTANKLTGELIIGGSGEIKANDYNFYKLAQYIKKITIQEGITEIEFALFENFTYLSNVLFPESLTKIGSSSFAGCQRLEEVEFPSNLNSIDYNAFKGCLGLKKIVVPDSVSEVGYHAFDETGIKELTIPLGKNYNCDFVNINKLILTASNSENNYQWKDTPWYKSGETISEVVICDGIKRLSDNSLCDLNNITSVSLPNSLIEIGADAFAGCSSLKTVEFPTNLKKIGSGAFYKCSSLSEVVIPNGVEIIDRGAFEYCDGIKKLSIPVGAEFRYDAFKGCINVDKLILSRSDNSETFNFNGALDAIADLRTAKEIIIKEGVTSIGKQAFYCFSRIKTLTIPSSVKTIGHSAFMKSSIESLAIPDSVTEFGESAFSGSKIKSIQIPNSITKIEHSAFSNCMNLETIVIPDSVVEICDYAFDRCLNLQSIQLSKNLERIGDYAFNKCNLLNLTLPNKLKRIGTCTFSDNQSLGYYNPVYVPKGINYIGDNAFNNTYKIKFDCDNGLSRTGLGSISEIVFEHAFDKQRIEKPTCLELGRVFKVCSKCGKEQFEDYLDLAQHKYGDWAVINPSTCTEQGFREKHCLWCGVVFGEVTPILGHDYRFNKFEWNGYTAKAVYVCKHDSTHVEKHATTVKQEIVKQPSFTNTGLRVYTVSYDGHTDKKEEVLPILFNSVVSGKAKKTVVKWNKADDKAIGYEVYRSTNPNTGFKKIATIKKPSTLSYTDKKTKAGVTYYYKVRPVFEVTKKWKKIVRTGEYSNVESFFVFKNAPKLALKKGVLSWKKVAGAEKYEVYRSTAKKGTYELLDTTTALKYTDSTATVGVTYYYKVRAVKGEIVSSYSTVRSFKKALIKPSLKSVKYADGKITVITNATKDAGVGYDIQISTRKNKGFKSIPVDELTATYTISKKGTYYFKVRTYVTVNGKKYYSAFSKVKYVKVKKL